MASRGAGDHPVCNLVRLCLDHNVAHIALIEEFCMTANAVIRARIDEQTKAQDQRKAPCHGCPTWLSALAFYRKPDSTVLQLVRLGSHSELGL